MATRKKKVIPIQNDGPSCSECLYGIFDIGADFGACRFRPLSWVYDPVTETSDPHHDPAYSEGWCAGFVRKSH